MRVFAFRSLAVAAIGFFLLSLLSCAHDQQLVGITIVPETETFGSADIPVFLDAGLSVQLRALGTYIHPPVTKDITDQVTWGSNDIQMVTVNPTGLITATGNSCGGTLISATVNTNSSAGNRTSSGAIVTNTMNANVVCFTGTGSGAGPLLAVNILSGTGTVVSSPSGINCPSTCAANFASGTGITLTATPTGTSTAVTWSGCVVSSNPLVCTINALTADTVVTASFN